MKFRKSTDRDIQQIMFIIEQAKVGLKSQEIDQWQNGYPNKDSILEDIHQGDSYVIEDDGAIIATCMISDEKDPNYAHIEDGSWLQDGSYRVVHRVATHPLYKGKNIASLLLSNAETMVPAVISLRADTHEKNLSMQRLLDKNGFTYCGIVYVSDGTRRKAYEKILKS